MDKVNGKILEGYCHTKKDVIDCQLMHIKDICATFGLPISGAMCFGLSEAYDFSYWIQRKSKISFLVMLGRSMDALETFFKKVSIEYDIKYIHSKYDFEQHIDNVISNGNISLIYTDRYYLRYLEKKYNRAHFGNHVLSISGYRACNDIIEYAINDVISDNVIWYNSDELNTARLSEWEPFSPNGKVIDVYVNSLKLNHLKDNISKMIIVSIQNVANKMLNNNSGVKAMKKLSYEISCLVASDLKKYSRAIKFQLRLISSLIREFEETHSFYRMVYSNFLYEASSRYGLKFLSDYAVRMKDIADQWLSISKLIAQNDDISITLKELSRKLLVLSDLEKLFFQDMQRLILDQQNSI